MPCPLRVPLAMVSAVGAVAVAVGALEGADSRAVPLPAAGGRAGGSGTLWAWLLFLFDLFSGQYLLELYRGQQEAGRGTRSVGVLAEAPAGGPVGEGKKAV